MREVVARLGPLIPVTAPAGTFMVPRHFVALHGLYAEELPALAERYGWERLEGQGPGAECA
jgi:hypothetical protein